mmetsp:Transcript_10626/g.24647  ORF Transcript_10626/g.24647 Transcript_10626/m.24647 type:complete len:256 (+) Transcript_10626:37-804(+)
MFFISTHGCALPGADNASMPSSRVIMQLPNQLHHGTAYDRYPHAYKAVRDLYLQRSECRTHRCHTQPPKILDFGSSGGVEAYTLAVKYFPQSFVVGVDVDAKVLTAARQLIANRNISHRVVFFDGTEFPLDILGRYDIVFANSVLCRTKVMPGPTQYPFSAFEQTLHGISTVLKPGGILCIVNPSYRLQDTALSVLYEDANVTDQMRRTSYLPAKFGRIARNVTTSCGHSVPLYDPQGNPMKEVYDKCIFIRKQT